MSWMIGSLLVLLLTISSRSLQILTEEIGEQIFQNSNTTTIKTSIISSISAPTVINNIYKYSINTAQIARAPKSTYSTLHTASSRSL